MPEVTHEAYFERLGAMDRQFLAMESANAHMHVSGFSIYALDPAGGDTDGVDYPLFREAIDSVLWRVPRYRQRIIHTPIEGHPVWVDADRFDLDDHLRHLSLPAPGSEAQLKQMVSWIVSQPLDASRPLWEMWVVEGLDAGKSFAVVTKMHHCMIDGSSGVNLMQLLLRTAPDSKIPASRPFVPRPAPTPSELVVYEIGHRARTPLRVLGGLRNFVARGSTLPNRLAQRAGAFGELMENFLPASKTPISRAPLGPRRRVDWLEMPMEEVTALRRRLGCSLNDLVLTIVSGAVRRYLARRDVELEGIDFRVSIPVNIRREDESEEMNNRISSWILPLPLAEADPLKQLAAIRERTSELKKSNQAVAVEMMMTAAEEIPALLTLSAVAMRGQISMIVTNVPGPPIPLYLLEYRSLSMQPLVPLFPGVGIGIAALSYDGTLFWGLQGEYDLVPDLDRFAEDIRDSLRALADAGLDEESGLNRGDRSEADHKTTRE